MIDIAIEYDKEKLEFRLYEPTTDTLFVTSSLGESFYRLSKFLEERGMIVGDILGTDNIRYHLDSATFLALVESNVNLLKRLNTAPSGFSISSQRFGTTGTTNNNTGDGKKRNKSTGTFSKSSFNNSNKKFGNR